MSETTQPIAVTLTAEQWNVVGAALGELPHKIAASVYGLIAQQVQAGARHVVAEPAAEPSAAPAKKK